MSVSYSLFISTVRSIHSYALKHENGIRTNQLLDNDDKRKGAISYLVFELTIGISGLFARCTTETKGETHCIRTNQL